MAIYAADDGQVAHRVREWAIAHGDEPLMRIALCGYDGEHAMSESWAVVRWSTSGGYAKLVAGGGMENRHRERIWFSPHCLPPRAPGLFDGVADDEVDSLGDDGAE